MITATPIESQALHSCKGLSRTSEQHLRLASGKGPLRHERTLPAAPSAGWPGFRTPAQRPFQHTACSSNSLFIHMPSGRKPSSEPAQRAMAACPRAPAQGPALQLRGCCAGGRSSLLLALRSASCSGFRDVLRTDEPHDTAPGESLTGNDAHTYEYS